MPRSKFSPAEKRAFTTLRNLGYEVKVIRPTPAKVVSQSVVAAPQPALVPAPRKNGYASKAERAIGAGNRCTQCARADLRYPVRTGSYHDKDVNGSGIRCEIA